MRKKDNKYDIPHYNFRNISTTKRQTAKPSIQLNEPESDSEHNNPKPVSTQKTKNIRGKFDEIDNYRKLLGNKHKLLNEHITKRNKNNEYTTETIRNKKTFNENTIKSPKKNKKSFFSDSESSSPKHTNNNKTVYDKITTEDNNNNKSTMKTNKNNTILNQKKEEDENTVIFPYKFTEEIIEALSCKYCGGIYVRPYIIKIEACMHIFCVRCIMKILEDKSIGECFVCKTQFTLKEVKYSEVTDYYVKKFFPQIPKLIEESKKKINNFMEDEVNSSKKNKIVFSCELRPYTDVSQKYRLPDIFTKFNKLNISINSGNDNIVNIIKNEIIRRLKLNITEEDIELRINGTEVSQFETYELLKKGLDINEKETNIIYYNKKVSK